MPPKKKGGSSKKAEQKKIEKIVEDKTFGLKNKNRSKKVQQYCASVKQAAEQKVRPRQRGPTEAEKRKEQKRLEEQKERERKQLFRPEVQQPKVPPGVDPKSFVCELWKRGMCHKGDKCKFAHDLNAGRKKEQIDLYTDKRALQQQTVADWNQETLEKVVEQRRTEKNRRNQTNIVCKYFLEALEKSSYGWFWECPNGDDCPYVHALPPGFVLQRKEKNAQPIKTEDDGPSLEEQIEAERLKVRDGPTLTKELFLAWKKAKEERKAKEAKQKEEEKKQAVQQGRTVLLNGRELLIYRPQLFADEEEAMDDHELERMTEAEFDALQNAEAEAEAAAAPAAAAAAAAEGSAEDTGDFVAAAQATAAAAASAAVSTEDVEKAMQAVSLDEQEAAEKDAVAKTVGDASLFMDDDDDDEEEDEEAEEEGEKEEGAAAAAAADGDSTTKA